jgi:undecaprenyl diphosphate synthase
MQDTPRHVAIVMDGNGRWAKREHCSVLKGHQAGVKALKNIVKAAISHKISYLSVFAFSTENWQRSKTEVSALMRLFVSGLKSEVPALHQEGIRLRFVGDRSRLSKRLQDAMQHAETLTHANTRLSLVVAMDYGGRWDVVQAAKQMAASVKSGELSPDAIDEERFSRYLSGGDIPDPDLFIRTSGEERISNFYLWQLAYSELYFTQTLWPDFDEAEFLKALSVFSERNRRYGLRQEEETSC